MIAYLADRTPGPRWARDVAVAINSGGGALGRRGGLPEASSTGLGCLVGGDEKRRLLASFWKKASIGVRVGGRAEVGEALNRREAKVGVSE